MDASGWVAVPELIASLRCKPTEAEVRCVVETNNKVQSRPCCELRS